MLGGGKVCLCAHKVGAAGYGRARTETDCHQPREGCMGVVSAEKREGGFNVERQSWLLAMVVAKQAGDPWAAVALRAAARVPELCQTLVQMGHDPTTPDPATGWTPRLVRH